MYNFSDNKDDFTTCPECEKQFISSHKHRKYCSEECFNSARHKYIKARDRSHYIKNRTCKHCGEVVKSAKKDLHCGGCCKKEECIEAEKKHRQRVASRKYYNKNKKKTVRDKNKDAESSRKYRKNHRERINNKNNYRKKKKRQWIIDLKQKMMCKRCNNDKFYCLDFHHLNPEEKDFSISHAISRKYGKQRILDEIKKCIVLCKNCHSEAHYYLEIEKDFDINSWINIKGIDNKNII